MTFTSNDIMCYYIKGRIDALETVLESSNGLLPKDFTDTLKYIIGKEKEKYDNYQNSGV